MKKAFDHTTIGYNFKFTEFQAAVGIAQMKKLPDRIVKKKKMFQSYKELLTNNRLIEFVETDLTKITPWMIDILLKSKKTKEQLIKYLEKQNIGTRIFYPPIHRLKPYKNSDIQYKNTSDISDRALWLPSSVTLTDDEIQLICKEMNKFLKT